MYILVVLYTNILRLFIIYLLLLMNINIVIKIDTVVTVLFGQHKN